MSNGHTPEQRAALSAKAKKQWAEGRFTRTREHNAGIKEALLRYWSQNFRERVLAKVDTSGGPDVCWPWTGSCDAKGYGRLKRGGRVVKAHRVVYELLTGEKVPDWALLLHDCRPYPDNPACCNPKHLRWGTLQENSEDAILKGQCRHGESHPGHKLTEVQVVDIREQVASGLSQTRIALDFNIPQTKVSSIARGESWSHVGGPRKETRCNIKLFAEQVVEIRRRAAAGEKQVALAKEFHVMPVTISSVVRKRSWKHI